MDRYNELHASVKRLRRLQTEIDADTEWMAEMAAKLENERLGKRKRKVFDENAGRDSYYEPAMDFSSDEELSLDGREDMNSCSVDEPSLAGSDVSSASSHTDRTEEV